MQPYRAFPRFKGSNYCLTCTPSILCPWLLSLPSPSTIYKDKFPDGIYLSLTPGDPSLWSGVLFVHSGMSTSDASEPVKLLHILTQVYRPIRVSCSSLTDLIPTVVSGVASTDHLLD